jgi:hypothetical protein
MAHILAHYRESRLCSLLGCGWIHVVDDALIDELREMLINRVALVILRGVEVRAGLRVVEAVELD